MTPDIYQKQINRTLLKIADTNIQEKIKNSKAPTPLNIESSLKKLNGYQRNIESRKTASPLINNGQIDVAVDIPSSFYKNQGDVKDQLFSPLKLN